MVSPPSFWRNGRRRYPSGRFRPPTPRAHPPRRGARSASACAASHAGLARSSNVLPASVTLTRWVRASDVGRGLHPPPPPHPLDGPTERRALQVQQVTQPGGPALAQQGESHQQVHLSDLQPVWAERVVVEGCDCATQHPHPHRQALGGDCGGCRGEHGDHGGSVYIQRYGLSSGSLAHDKLCASEPLPGEVDDERLDRQDPARRLDHRRDRRRGPRPESRPRLRRRARPRDLLSEPRDGSHSGPTLPREHDVHVHGPPHRNPGGHRRPLHDHDQEPTHRAPLRHPTRAVTSPPR